MVWVAYNFGVVWTNIPKNRRFDATFASDLHSHAASDDTAKSYIPVSFVPKPPFAHLILDVARYIPVTYNPPTSTLLSPHTMTNPASELTTVQLLEALRTNPEARAAIDSLYGKGHNAQRDAQIAQKVWAGATQASVAREYNLSVNRIAQIMASRPNPNPVKVNPHAERNRLILDAARRKVPRAEIARQHGLSVIRVNQIVGAEPKVKKLTLREKAVEVFRKYDAFEDLTFEDECILLATKYNPHGVAIAQHLHSGKDAKALLAWDYRPDFTGGDVKWTAEHYHAVVDLLYNPETNGWRGFAPL